MSKAAPNHSPEFIVDDATLKQVLSLIYVLLWIILLSLVRYKKLGEMIRNNFY